MTPEQLKASILQYAIQGKLVEQRPEEGTAEDLYKAIQEEKQKLIKEGKIKKEKPLDAIAEEDIPFDIPCTWKWCYLGEIFTHTAGKALNAKNTTGEKHKYITTSNVYWDHFELDNLKEMYYAEDEIEKYSVQYGDLLVLEGGDVGRTAIWNLNESYCIQNHIHRLRPYTEVNIKYFYYVMMYLKFRGDIAGKGIGIKGLSANALHCINIPLPPLEEQHRIVEKIEELLPYVDRYAEAHEKLEKFNAKFPEDMKKSILQYAIQGKLVEQREEKGTAEELYQQIQDEKAKLIKEGKIKKEKPLGDIVDDDIPFDIPESWRWCRFQDLCSVLTCGYASTPTYVSEDVGMPFISAKNVKPYRFMPEDHKFIGKELYEQLIATAKPEKGDILLTRVGAGIGEAAIIDVDMDFAIYVSLTLIKLVNTKMICNRYILHWLNSPLGTITAQKNIFGKGASQGNLNVKNVREFIVPLPPYEEQVRIADKIDELLPYCNKLINN